MMKALLFSFTALLLFSNPATGQTGEAFEPVYVQVDYMKPLDNMAKDYVEMEQTIWKPIHRERIAGREILAWYLFELQYPRGTAQEYDYVTVTVFSNLLGLDDAAVPFEEIVDRAHPGITVEEVEQSADATRDLVKSEVWKSLMQLRPIPAQPPKCILVDYMKVKPENTDEYLRLEKEIWQPVHKLRYDEGYVQNWTVYALQFPGGTQYAYSHATATVFDSWVTIKDSWPDDAFARAHHTSKDEPSVADEETMIQTTHETRELVSSQIWNLVDYVIAGQEN